MRFMTLWRPGKNAKPRSERLDVEMGELIQQMAEAGVLVQVGGWDPEGPCTIVRSSSGEVTVTDGPFTETKEMIAGFALLQVESKAEALRWTRRFLEIVGDGTSELRPIPEEPQS